MKPQSHLFRESVTVEPYQGSGAVGPVYGSAITVACRASFARTLIRDAAGQEVISELTLYVQPDDETKFPAGSRVTYGDYMTSVMVQNPQGPPGSISQVKVMCK